MLEIFDTSSGAALNSPTNVQINTSKISALSGALSNYVMVGSTNGAQYNVLLYNYADSTYDHILGHDSEINAIHASPDGSTIAVGESSTGMKIWKSTEDNI